MNKLRCPECGLSDYLYLEERVLKQTKLIGLDEDGDPVVTGPSVEIDSDDLDYPVGCHECGRIGVIEDFVI